MGFRKKKSIMDLPSNSLNFTDKFHFSSIRFEREKKMLVLLSGRPRISAPGHVKDQQENVQATEDKEFNAFINLRRRICIIPTRPADECTTTVTDM
jgi:hypothetical protein